LKNRDKVTIMQRTVFVRNLAGNVHSSTCCTKHYISAASPRALRREKHTLAPLHAYGGRVKDVSSAIEPTNINNDKSGTQGKDHTKYTPVPTAILRPVCDFFFGLASLNERHQHAYPVNPKSKGTYLSVDIPA
jgi:hypothetical protein